MEADHVGRLEHAAGIDGREAIRVNPQDLLIARILNALRQPQIPRKIEDPPGNAIGIGAYQRALAGGDFKLVKIVPGFIAVVEPDIEHVGIRFWRAKQHYAHALEMCKIARWRGIAIGRIRRAGIYGIHVEVFIPRVVLHKDQVPAVATPQIASHGPRGFGCHQPCRAERLASLLHPDVARFLPRFLKCDELAVGR